MKKTKEIKLMILENFIDHFTSNDKERESMKEDAKEYVEEDHVDEIDQAITEPIRLELGGMLPEDLTKAEANILAHIYHPE